MKHGKREGAILWDEHRQYWAFWYHSEEIVTHADKEFLIGWVLDHGYSYTEAEEK